MNHRGRLNVMTNTIGRPASEIFTKFEDVDPRSTLGGGDVKYHLGATGDYTSPSGKIISLHLASNPSHLEAVDPVLIGRTRARQERIGEGRQEAGSSNPYPRRCRLRRARNSGRDPQHGDLAAVTAWEESFM